MSNQENKLTPILKFKEFNTDWNYNNFNQFINRRSKSIDTPNLLRIEYEDIVSGQGKLNKNILQKISNKKGVAFFKGDILFGKLRPYLKNWLFAKFDGIAVGDWWVLYSKKIDSKYIYGLIQSEKFQNVANLSTGTKMPRSDWNLVSTTKFSFPDNIAEQKKIGTTLINLDKIISTNQQKLTQLKELKKSLLQKMFADTDTPILRFNSFNDDWKMYKLKDLINKQVKGTSQLAKLGIGKVEYLDTDRSNGGRILLTDGQLNVNKDDILILWDGSKAGTIYTGFSGTLGSTLKAYKVNEKNNSQFIYQFLINRQQDIYINYRTPNIPHVQKDFLNIFSIITPSFEEQTKLGTLFNKLDKLIDNQDKKIAQLKELKKGMLQKMFC